MKNLLLAVIVLGCLHKQAVSSPIADQYSHSFSLQHPNFFGYLIKSFSGTMNVNSISLNWELINIEMSMTCSVEVSNDGQNFSNLKSFDIDAGFQGTMNYQDRSTNNTDRYYRLVLSKPGYTSFVSNVIVVKINPAISSYSVQNPFHDQINIKGNFSEFRALKIEMTDMNGRTRLTRQLDNVGKGSVSISTRGLHGGFYILRVSNASNDQKSLITKCVYKQAE